VYPLCVILCSTSSSLNSFLTINSLRLSRSPFSSGGCGFASAILLYSSVSSKTHRSSCIGIVVKPDTPSDCLSAFIAVCSIASLSSCSVFIFPTILESIFHYTLVYCRVIRSLWIFYGLSSVPILFFHN